MTELITGRSRVEYSAWRNGSIKIEVEGMPPGKYFTEPHRYGDDYLAAIIAAKDGIKFAGKPILVCFILINNQAHTPL